jgi:hypothetical protein
MSRKNTKSNRAGKGDRYRPVDFRRLPSDFAHIRIHYTADPKKRGDWNRRLSAKYGGMEDPRWQREMEISYNAYTGQRLWPLLSDRHFSMIDVFDGNWCLYRSIDQGIRHPCVCAWVAVNKYGDRHVFREFYSVGRSIAENCRLIRGIDKGESIAGSIIDPSTRKRSEESLTPLIEIFAENGLFCELADNSFAGYDRVSQMLLSTLCRAALRGEDVPELDTFDLSKTMLKEFAQYPCLTFNKAYTSRIFRECKNLRWQENKGDMTQKGIKEKPVDVEDDGADVVRYACQTELSYTEPVKQEFDLRQYWKLKNENRQLAESLSRSQNRAYC